MSAYILPTLICGLLLYSAFKRVGVYDCFTQGAKEALHLIYSVFPYVCAIFVCIQLFKQSGLSEILTSLLKTPLEFLGIPYQLAELILLRPISGNGSLAILENILTEYGADSYISKCAAVIMGSSETILYISAVYVSGCKIKKLRGAVSISIFASLVGSVVACLLCRFF